MAGPLISAPDLAARTDPKPVMLDCRFSLADTDAGRRQYIEGHIPGAVYMDLERDLSGPLSRHGGRHPLPEPESLADTFRKAGINQDTHVVAYDDSRFAFASRAWWLLRYLGHGNVSVLDGGFSAWVAAGLPVETEQPQPALGDFMANIQPELVVDYQRVRKISRGGGAQLVDCREKTRYLGLEEPLDPVAGHIPGAVNYPWQAVTDTSGLARPAAEHVSRWQDLPVDQELVFYCGSGVTACVNQLSMELAGRDMGKLYVGSWSDWCSYLDQDDKR